MMLQHTEQHTETTMNTTGFWLSEAKVANVLCTRSRRRYSLRLRLHLHLHLRLHLHLHLRRRRHDTVKATAAKMAATLVNVEATAAKMVATLVKIRESETVRSKLDHFALDCVSKDFGSENSENSDPCTPDDADCDGG